jgi:regulator of sigma E protease
VVEPAAPGLAGIREGARVVAVNGRPVREWNDLVAVLGDSAQRSAELRFADAPPVTLALPAGDAARSAALAGLEPWVTPVIEKVERGKPARRAGLRAGDRVVAAEGAPVRSWQELVRAIQSHPEKPLRLSVARGARTIAVTVTPDRANGQTASGKPVAIGRAGAGSLQPLNVRDRVGAGRAVVLGARATWGMAAEITGYLVKLVKGELSARNMGGLLSIGEASGQTARMGLEVFLGFLAAFSVNLAVLNLLPIPILDGGHLMFLAFEAVRGRPLSVEARIRLSHVGLVILFALMIWANGNDVLRLVFGR